MWCGKRCERNHQGAARVARILHADGTESRKVCLAPDEALRWIQAARRSFDDIVIENAPSAAFIN